MGLKNRVPKFSGKMTKEKWSLLLLIGALLMILSPPLLGNRGKNERKESQAAAGNQGLETVSPWTGDAQDPAQTGKPFMFRSLGQDHMGNGSPENSEGDPVCSASTSPDGEGSYKTQMKNRIKNLSKSVDGVEGVDAMVVSKSSNGGVVKIDQPTSSSTTQGKNLGGDTRGVVNSQSDESTVLSDSSSNGNRNVLVVKRELSPEISGIIISAEGGGSPTMKTGISEAVETLLGPPPHRIKALERVR